MTGPRDGIIDLNLLSVINLKSNSVKKFDEVREMIVYGELSVPQYGIIDLNLLSIINLKSNSVKKFDEVREMIVYGRRIM